MTDLILSKTETKLLLAATEAEGGLLVFPENTKPSTRERILGRLVRDGFVTASEDGTRHHVTPAGYRALGLRPPRAKRPKAADAATTMPRVTKGALILGLLGRGEGASLTELTDATGWLPHTTRAALSRLRSAGKALAKSKREDGTTAYRLMTEEPIRRARKPRAEATAQVAV